MRQKARLIKRGAEVRISAPIVNEEKLVVNVEKLRDEVKRKVEERVSGVRRARIEARKILGL